MQQHTSNSTSAPLIREDEGRQCWNLVWFKDWRSKQSHAVSAMSIYNSNAVTSIKGKRKTEQKTEIHLIQNKCRAWLEIPRFHLKVSSENPLTHQTVQQRKARYPSYFLGNAARKLSRTELIAELLTPSARSNAQPQPLVRLSNPSCITPATSCFPRFEPCNRKSKGSHQDGQPGLIDLWYPAWFESPWIKYL